MKSKFFLPLLLLNFVTLFSLYSQSVRAFPFSPPLSIPDFLKGAQHDSGKQHKSGQNSDQNITLPKEVTPNSLYPTGRFQTILIPEDTSSETSCSNLNLKDDTPTVQIAKTSTSISPNIVLRSETGNLRSENSQDKNFSKYLSSGKTYSLTITNLVDLSLINNTNSVGENSSKIIPFSVISAKDLCSDLQKLSENKDKEIDEYQKKIGEPLLYGKYNLYSYAIPKLEGLLLNNPSSKYDFTIYTYLAYYYDEIGFLEKSKDNYINALGQAEKCSDKNKLCDLDLSFFPDKNINNIQAIINQRLGYIYLYNRSIPSEQERLTKSSEFLKKAKKSYQCQDDSKDINCQTLNKELKLLEQLELPPLNQ